MKATKKQLFSLLLALAMLLTLAPFGVIRAAEESEEGFSPPMPDNEALEVTEVTEDVSEIIATDGTAEVPSDMNSPDTFLELETEENGAADFTEDDIELASDISPAPPDGTQAVTGASATVRAAPSTISIPKGSSAKVTLTHSGYNGYVYYKYAVSSQTVFSLNWIGWDSYYSYSFKVNGLQPGSGIIRMYLYSYPGNQKLGYVDISVTVTENAPPMLTIQPSTLKLSPSESGKFNVSFKNCQGASRLQYQISNESVVQCQWAQSVSGEHQVSVRALKAGYASVSIYVRDAYGGTLAYSSASVTVEQDLSLSVSTSSVTVQSGRSVSAKVTVQGSGSYRMTCTSSNSTAFGCSFTDSSSQGATVTKTLVITGRNTGSGYVKVYLKTPNGETLKSAKINVSVTSKAPTLSVTPTSVSTPAQVKCTLTGSTGDERLYYSVSDSGLMDCSWSEWQNNVIYLNITGKKSGNGTVKIYLYYDGEKKFVSSVSVRTSGASAKTIRDYSYPFSNYSKPSISLSVCQYMFGKNQYAQQAYNWNLGDGGVCFGLATTAGLFSGGSPAVSGFGKSSISKIYRSYYSNALQLYLYEFVEAMHLSQKAQSMLMYSANSQAGLQNVVQALNSGPVVLCIIPKNSGDGHAILAYDYVNGALKAYDPNAPLREKSLSISGNSWSYVSTSGSRWTNSAYNMYYIPYSAYSSVWNQRGFLTPKAGASARNLLITSAKDFSLYAFDGQAFSEEPVVKYQGGVAQVMSEDAQELYRAGAMPGMESADDQPIMLYLPVGDYKMVSDADNSALLDVSLSDENVAVRVTTDAGECYLRASDETEEAFSTLPGIEDGRKYAVSLYSMEDGLSKEITVHGENRSYLETTVSLDAVNDAAMISSQAFGDSALSVEEAAAADMGDIALSIPQETELPDVFISWTEGGRVEKETVANGETICRITPDDGYITRDVLISESLETDLASQGAIAEYLFRGTDGVLHAEFARKAESAWDVKLSGATTEDGLPKVTVTRKDGAEDLPALEEGADYVVSYEDLPGERDALYVTATPESGFIGVLEMPVELPAEAASDVGFELDAERTAYWKDDAGIQVRVISKRAGPAVIAVAAYAQNHQMIALKLDSLSESETEKTISLTPENPPDAFTVKAFLLRDAKTMEPLYDLTVPPREG